MKNAYLGGQLKRLRETHAMTQAALARSLDISPSYLNQIERNQRPLTLAVLAKLDELFGPEAQPFHDAGDGRLASRLRAALACSVEGFVAEVEELTHVDSVDVVGFSMGGLSLRHYIRFLGGGAEVSRYVSIDTPQYGEVSACLLPAESGGQMCPFSDFLNDLNTGDDTPGNVAYTTILNQQGNPAQGRLRGGAGELQVAGAHGDLLGSAEVHDAVLASLRR